MATFLCLPHFQRLLGWASGLALTLTLGCGSMTHEVRIQASPREVWGVLVDLQAYPQWNPFFVKAVGKLEVGEKLQITMVPVGKGPQSFSPRVLEMERDHEIVWRGRLGVPGLFDGRHTFTIQRIDDKTVLFKQYEHFSGLLVPFAGLGPYRKGWERMDRALQLRVEGDKAEEASRTDGK